jgi:Protein of unknown function (DUF3071)
MRTLRLVALSDDGQSLILTAESPDGLEEERFELPIDERVRAAARGDARLGAIEDVGNTLPPRVIQARIRAGETPEQVAAASGTRVDRIMRFAHPVLQERARIAEQARAARVRLSEGLTNTTLERFMSGRLRLLGADVDGVHWDAHRPDDGGWLVTAAWQAGAKSGITQWTYDIPARTVTPLDAATTDFAEGTRLVRVVPDVPGNPAPAPERPVAVVRHAPAAPAAPPAPQVEEEDDAHVRDVVPADGVPAEPLDDDLAEHDTVVLGRAPDENEDPRARIPAWEDIVFGVRRHR